MKKKILILSTLILLFNCVKTVEITKIKKINIQEYKFKIKPFLVTKNWHLKDIEIDSIPGISLKRAAFSLLTDRGASTIVAVIDTEMDINHEGLVDKFWTNKNEIPNNKIDDDKNGYIDDINGWNFLGNQKGENNKFVNFESTRILRKNKINLSLKESLVNETFDNVKHNYDEKLKYHISEKENADRLYDYYFGTKEKLSSFFVNKPFNIRALDSLKKTKTSGVEESLIEILIELIENNIDDDYVLKESYVSQQILDKLLGLKYNDRLIQGDNPDDLSDTKYGNNILNANIKLLTHGTKMAGIIANMSFNNEIQIMPLAISAYGDEHDKDIALAIRYAVNNGAKVINMSFGKEFSMHKQWVFDAIKYAEKNNVLIISSAGNFGYDLNTNNDYYPNDNLNNKKEVADNFILVGATSHSINKDFKTEISNYGTIDVDLFAPGNKIFTTLPNNNYSNDAGGTSSASAITAGVAGLLFSYYPNLKASQVKHILMDSGLEYTIDVSTPTKEDKNKTTPFNKLSKSGKVLNAYNALIMADSISRN